jgi:hypothetical protein
MAPGDAAQVAAEGLRVAEELVRTMRPAPEQPVPKSLQVGQTGRSMRRVVLHLHTIMVPGRLQSRTMSNR